MAEDLRETLGRVLANRAPRERAHQERLYNKDSAARLRSILRKKVTTSFVGAIAKFEEKFGRLWGHGLSLDECSDKQREFRVIWQQCRTEVFDLGNTQLGGLDSELRQYQVVWNRYQTQFRVDTDGSDEDGDCDEE